MHEQYKIYLSCSWYFDNAYLKLTKMLDAAIDFPYVLHTVQAHIARSPEYQGKMRYERIKEKMEKCDALLLLGGVYPHYNDWISKEIMACKKEENKPLIVVHKDQTLHISPVVNRYADRLVHWDADEMIAALRDLLQ